MSNDVRYMHYIFNEHIRQTVKERCQVNLDGDLSIMLQDAFQNFHGYCQTQHIADNECYYTKEQYCTEIMRSYKESAK